MIYGAIHHDEQTIMTLIKGRIQSWVLSYVSIYTGKIRHTQTWLKWVINLIGFDFFFSELPDLGDFFFLVSSL